MHTAYRRVMASAWNLGFSLGKLCPIFMKTTQNANGVFWLSLDVEN